ncbi:MAG: hypothetical protein ACTS8W_03670 [Arsenophonus sp. NC-PY1-MAG3]
MTRDKKYSKKSVETKYGKVKVAKQVKYLGEIICENGTNKKAMEAKKLKLEQQNWATKNIYNKKNLSVNAELRHYNSVVRPIILYVMETTKLSGKDHILKEEI